MSSTQITGRAERANPPLSVPASPEAPNGLCFVAYYRVSTDRQGRSGLGLEAQREAVRQFLVARPGRVLAELVEVESGRKDDRPRLQEALRLCQRSKATLLIAKLDRLARSVSFVASMMDGTVDFIATDMPEATRFVLHIMAAVAEHERQMIGDRTRAALQAARARGILLGKNGERLAEWHKAHAAKFAEKVRPDLEAGIRSGAKTTRALAIYLNGANVPAREGGLWHPAGVARVLKRLNRPAQA